MLKKIYRGERVLKEKLYIFLSKTRSPLKNPFRGRILSVAKNSPL